MKNNIPIVLDETQTDEIVKALKNGKAIIGQTDTIFGIMSSNLEDIYELKQRPKEKKVGCFISNTNQISGLNEKKAGILNKFWPSPISVVINQISYRIPGYKPLLDIVKKTGLIFQSSANISGKDVVKNIEEAIEVFKDNYDKVIFIKTKRKNSVNSTIVDLDNMKIIRNGEVDGNIILDEIKEIK
ncbi:MAG: Sua5/YciO/YrdC/YwlC family protein [Mycoplasmataceae bacterium]|jgi:L-threonylcarbamoyladenylate synthase|nr:Sua5/YciO/YrdC/YwlC family protein [Mycoplasmataceae bacterium]